MIVIPSAERRGGGDVWLAALLSHPLLAECLELTAVFESHGPLAELAAAAGHRTAVLGRRGPATRRNLLSLAAPLSRIVRTARPEVTVHWSPRAHVYGTAARKLTGAPGAVAWVQHVMPSRFWLHRLASSLPADTVLCVSSAAAREQRRLYPRRPVRVLQPGIDVTIPALDKPAARRAQQLPEQGLVVGVVGRVEPWKGQDIAVRALHALRGQLGQDSHLMCVGETRSGAWPGFSGEVLALIGDLGLQRHVTFTGHLQNPAGALVAMDVLLCPSREEGFGIAVAEAMAVGVPVVVARCGGPEDLIAHGTTGLLTPPHHPLAAAAAIARFTDEPELAQRLATAARRAYDEQFTAHAGADRFVTTVQALTP
jgi:glycosyltransferase involved in cell wall biosynthesis